MGCPSDSGYTTSETASGGVAEDTLEVMAYLLIPRGCPGSAGHGRSCRWIIAGRGTSLHPGRRRTGVRGPVLVVRSPPAGVVVGRQRLGAFRPARGRRNFFPLG